MGFRISLIGCGGISRVGHGPALTRIASSDPEVELAACCDIREEQARSFADTFGFSSAYTDMDRMLDEVRPDAVLLAVPVPLTAELTIELLKKGIPVLLEKPPGLVPEETLRMCEAALHTNTPHQVAFNRRHMPVVTRFRELSAGTAFQTWEYFFYRTGKIDPHYETTAIHAIDTLRFLAGSDYKEIRFTYTESGSDKKYVPAIWMECTFANQTRGRITIQPATGVSLERFVAHGVNELYMGALPFYAGNGSADGSGRIVHLKDQSRVLDEVMPEAAVDVLNGYYAEDLHFIRCIQEGIRPKDDLASTLQSMEAASCIYKRAPYYCQSS